MPGRDPKEYSIDEVGIWLIAIGLGSKVEVFRENSVDGRILCNLAEQDLNALGLTHLQGAKIQRSLEFTRYLANETKKLLAVKVENAVLKAENSKLKKKLAPSSSRKRVKPAPKPTPNTAPPMPVTLPAVRGTAARIWASHLAMQNQAAAATVGANPTAIAAAAASKPLASPLPVAAAANKSLPLATDRNNNNNNNKSPPESNQKTGRPGKYCQRWTPEEWRNELLMYYQHCFARDEHYSIRKYCEEVLKEPVRRRNFSMHWSSSGLLDHLGWKRHPFSTEVQDTLDKYIAEKWKKKKSAISHSDQKQQQDQQPGSEKDGDVPSGEVGAAKADL